MTIEKPKPKHFPKLFRLIRLLGLSLMLGWLFTVTPAEACGCGIYIPREGAANVSQEQALIRWDGQTEDIVMSLGVHSISTEAACILPVPAPATVQLAGGRLFETLQELTKPQKQYRYAIRSPFSLDGGAAPGSNAVGAGAPVTLLQRQTLGSFEVSSLAASDATALREWLTSNGYHFPPDLDQSLQPYVDQKWYYVAIRLTPGDGNQPLQGALDPLWVTFAANKMVYPMRLSGRAKEPLLASLYVLADHRVNKSVTFGNGRTSFADWLEPNALAPDSPLEAFVTRKLFLTKFQDYIYTPGQINDDYFFSFAAADTPYHEVEIEYIYLPVFELLGGLTGLLLLGAGGIFFMRRRRRRVVGSLTGSNR